MSSAVLLVALGGDVRRIVRGGVTMIHHPSPRSADASANVLEALVEYTARQPAEVRAWMDCDKTFDAGEATRPSLDVVRAAIAAKRRTRSVPSAR
jgi:hypothetical protein